MEAGSGSPPRHRQESGLPPTACDTCYSRKIRCDRKSPCGNCQDSQISCRRERQRSERKPKDVLPPEIFDALHEIKSRMTALESAVSQSIALATANTSKPAIFSNTLERAPRQDRKRTSTEAFGVDTPARDSPYVKSGSDVYSTPPFSTYEAQNLIQQELSSTPGSSKNQRTALRSALSSLKQSLNTTINHAPPEVPSTLEDLQSLPMPSIELIQWMLQSKESGRAVVSGSEFMPFTSRDTIARMAREFVANGGRGVEPSSIICVAAYGGYFLQEIVLLGRIDETGMEDRLRNQAYEYFKTSRAWEPYMLPQLPITLSSLQALVYCFLLAQENGDFVAASTLVGAACKLCIALGLHKRINQFSSGPVSTATEAYYCFTTAYLNDKGLAMNLSTMPFLDDSIIEIDILIAPGATAPVLDNFHLYLRLAQIQGSIITDLRSSGARRQRQETLTAILNEMDRIWQLYQELHNINNSKTGEYDSKLESTMVEVAYFSIQTVIYQSSGTDTLKDSTRKEARLEAARTTLWRIQRAQALSKTSQDNSTYLKSSFTHWVILYYPFTPFFVLFCNVIQSRNKTDYEMMQQFVAYLAEMKDISISVEKLHELCLPFCALASSLLNFSNENTNTNTNSSNNIDNSNAQMQRNPFRNESAPMVPSHMYHQREAEAQPGPTSSNLQTPHGYVNYDNQTGYTQDTGNYGVPPIPYDMVGADGSYDFNADPFVWDFMSTQPMLQWLDSDFSVLEPPM